MSGQSTMTDQPAGARQAYARWRDAFVLPSTTAGRFLVLAAVLFVGAIPFYQWWAYYTVRITPDLADCGAIPPGADPAAYATQLSLCPAQVNRTVTGITLALAAAVPLLAVLIYRLWPRIHELRDGSKPLDRAEHAALWTDLGELVREAGLSHTPEFRQQPDPMKAEGHAYGAFPRYRVALTDGLCHLYRQDPERARAVIRHELAHLRNRDVDLTYLTLAVWRAFLVVVVLPTFVEIGVRAATGQVLTGIGLHQLAALAFVVVLVRLAVTAVVRAREYHADVRSAGDEGAGGALGAILDPPHPPRGAARGVGRWLLRVTGVDRLVSNHPTKADRLAALRDPHRLLRLNSGDAFVVGGAVGFGLYGLSVVFDGLLGLGDRALLLAAFVAAVPVTVVVTLAAVRSAYAALAAQRSVPTGLPAAAALVAGLVLGEAFSWGPLNGTVWLIARTTPGVAAAMVTAMLAGFALLLRWTVVAAGLWLRDRAAPGRWTPVWPAAAVLTPVAFLFLFWSYAHLGAADQLGTGRYLALVWGAELPMAFPGLFTAAVAGLAAFPFLAAVRRSRAGSGADPVGLSLAAGLAALVPGVLFFVAPLNRWWLWTVVDGFPADPDADWVRRVTGVVTAALVAGVFVAAYTGRRGAALGAVYGLSALCLAGGTIAAVLIVNWTARTAPGLDWQALQQLPAITLRQATMAGLPAVLVAALLGRLTALPWRAPGTPPAPARRPAPALLGGALVVVLTTAGLQAVTPTASMIPLGSQSAAPSAAPPAGPATAASPSPSGLTAADLGFRPQDYSLPTGLGVTPMCDWFKVGDVETLVMVAQNQKTPVDDLAWQGIVLQHAESAQLVTIGKAFATAASGGDYDGLLHATDAVFTFCTPVLVDKDTHPVPGTPLPQHDPCVVGHWRLSRSTLTQDFGPDLGIVVLAATGSYDSTLTGTGEGHDVAKDYVRLGATGTTEVKLTENRDQSYTWLAGAGVYLQRDPHGPDALRLEVGGQDRGTQDFSTQAQSSATTYTCTPTTLTLGEGTFVEEFTRMAG